MRASSHVPEVRVGVDVGGTFTDLVALVDGEVRIAKVPSTPSDQSAGVMTAVAATGSTRPRSAPSRTARRSRRMHCSSDVARAQLSSRPRAFAT